jgi:Domain of unknown function (DUF4190)
MSQSMPPPPPPMGYAQPGPYAPQRTSAAAVTSLICGILGCLIITGLVAIVTGIIGLRATRDPNVKGRGLAIAGLILGILGVIGGSGCLVSTAGVGVWVYRQAAPTVEASLGFTQAVGKGDVDSAMKFVDTTSISKAEVETMVSQLSSLGAPTDLQPSKFNIDANGLIDIGGTLTYPGNVTKTVDVQARKQPDGTVKIIMLEVK